MCYALLSFYMLLPFVFMSLFWSDKRFYTADAASKIYHPRAYYPAKFVAGLPFNVAVALSFHLIYYAMAGLRHAPWAVAQSAAIAVLMCLIGMQVRGGVGGWEWGCAWWACRLGWGHAGWGEGVLDGHASKPGNDSSPTLLHDGVHTHHPTPFSVTQ